MIISLNGSKSENAESAHKDSCLRKILAGYPAFDATMNDQKSKSYATKSPSQSKISLQQDDSITKTFLFGLMRLHKKKSCIPCIPNVCATDFNIYCFLGSAWLKKISQYILTCIQCYSKLWISVLNNHLILFLHS